MHGFLAGTKKIILKGTFLHKNAAYRQLKNRWFFGVACFSNLRHCDVIAILGIFKLKTTP